MTHRIVTIAVAGALCSAAICVHAQIRPAYNYPTRPAAGVQMGESPAYFSWWLGTGVGYDDNLFLTENNEHSSGFYTVSPGLRIDARSPGVVLEFTHQHQIGRYWTSHNDDYIDHTTHVQGDVALSSRTFSLIAMYWYIPSPCTLNISLGEIRRSNQSAASGRG